MTVSTPPSHLPRAKQHKKSAPRLRFWRGLRVRALTILGVLFLSYALLIAGLDIFQHHKTMQGEIQARLSSLTRMMAGTASAGLAFGDMVNLKRILVETADTEDLRRIELYDLDKNSMLNADEESWVQFQPVHEPIARQALRHQLLSLAQTPSSWQAAVPVMIGEHMRGVLFMELDTAAFETRLHRHILLNLMLTTLFMALVLPLTALLIEHLIAELRSLTHAISHVARGQFDHPSITARTTEVVRLKHAFQRMTHRLRRSLRDVRQLAYTDPVTGLANRELMQRVAQSLFANQAYMDKGEQKTCFFFLDLDGFKRINDVMGHDVGDRLLVLVGARLIEQMQAASFDLLVPMADVPQSIDTPHFAVVARLGGDEFGLMITHPAHETITQLAQNIVNAIAQPFEVEGRLIDISVSLGIAYLQEADADFHTLMRHADMAMYQAKDQGQGGFAFFEPAMATKAVNRLVVEMELKKALGLGEIQPFFMPKYRLKDGQLHGFEVLARWNHPQKGILPPSIFMEIAGEAALEVAIDRTIMRQACRISAGWAKKGLHLPVAVNVGAAHLEQIDFAQEVADILHKEQLDGRLLEIEVTESVAMHNPKAAINAMTPLKDMGVRFAIDDFGTGYSNLSQLMRLPVDVFKLDRSLIEGAQEHTDGYILIRAIVGLARDLGLEIVAEGIEHEDQRSLAASLGCDLGQGYLYGAPMSLQEAERLPHLWRRAG